MANHKSTIHEMSLKTQDLCLNVFDADIKPYDDFRKNKKILSLDVITELDKQ